MAVDLHFKGLRYISTFSPCTRSSDIEGIYKWRHVISDALPLYVLSPFYCV